jgi:sugar lactone lactonase YvrE
MFYRSVITLVAVLALVVGSFPLQAQTAPAQAETKKAETKEAATQQAKPENVPALLVEINAAYAAKDYAAFRDSLEKLHKLRPYNSEYMYQLVIAYALNNEKAKAYEIMLGMQQQGLFYDFTKSEQTANIRGTEVFDYVNDLMIIAGNQVGEAEPVFVLPESVVMPETIAWDETRQKFLVGTISEGQILAVSKDGAVSELLKADESNGMWAIFDIQVDVPRNRLWVTSSSMPGYSKYDPVDRGRSALFEFDLKTLGLIKRYPVPVDGKPHILGSMVLDPDGGVYVADRNLPLIYRKSAGQDKLIPVLALKDMVSQRGIAMQADGRIMYVADREMGIMVVDFQSKQARFLEVPDTLNVGGIDGIYLDNNRLFVIQNGIKPQRVMRLQLDPTGTKVASVAPLAVALPEFDLPSFGTIVDDDLYFFGNSQWVGKKGSQKPVAVLRSSLNASPDLVKPEIEQFLKQQAEAEKQKQQEPNN